LGSKAQTMKNPVFKYCKCEEVKKEEEEAKARNK
jgi:hypothetical protein